MSVVEAYVEARADYVDAMRAFDALATRVRYADAAMRKYGIDVTADLVELPESHVIATAANRAKAAKALMLECWSSVPDALRESVQSPSREWRAA